MNKTELYNAIIQGFSRDIPTNVKDLAQELGFKNSSALLFHVSKMTELGLLTKVKTGFYRPAEKLEGDYLTKQNQLLKNKLEHIKKLINL